MLFRDGSVGVLGVAWTLAALHLRQRDFLTFARNQWRVRVTPGVGHGTMTATKAGNTRWTKWGVWGACPLTLCPSSLARSHSLLVILRAHEGEDGGEGGDGRGRCSVVDPLVRLRPFVHFPPCLSTVGELRQSKFVRIPTLMPWEPRVFRDVETMDASPSAPLDVVSSGDGTVRPWFVGTAAFGVSEVPRRGNRAGGGETGVRMVW